MCIAIGCFVVCHLFGSGWIGGVRGCRKVRARRWQWQVTRVRAKEVRHGVMCGNATECAVLTVRARVCACSATGRSSSSSSRLACAGEQAKSFSPLADTTCTNSFSRRIAFLYTCPHNRILKFSITFAETYSYVAGFNKLLTNLT